MSKEQIALQKGICAKYGAPFVSLDGGKIGIAGNVRDGILPINGLRHEPQGDTTGWYIWAGELSDDPDFFVPLHVAHLPAWCPEAVPYLGLPPGWRFLTGNGEDDVWEDPGLLDGAP